MIEVRTTLNPRITNPLLKLQIRRLRWFFFFIPAMFCAIGLLAIIGREDNSDIAGGIVTIVLGVGFLPLVYSLSRFAQKFINKTMKLLHDETLNYFRFEESMFYQETVKGDEYRGTTECAYSLLYKAYETKSHFFLFISNMQTHVVPKKDIVTGSAQELSDRLKALMGKRFKRLKIR